MIVTAGKEFIASFLNSAAAGASTFTARYVAIGTDATAAAAAQTALGTELARISGIVSYSTGGILSVVATFPSGTGTGAIVEYGLFSSSTGGTMLSRTVDGALNKGANDTLAPTIQITFS